MNSMFSASGWMLLGCLSCAEYAAAQLTLTQSAPIKGKATLELSSSTIQRGKTFIAGPSIQPSVWVFTSFGLGIGAWGAAPLENRDGDDPVFYEQNQGEFVKVDTYLGYKLLDTEFLTVESILAQYYFPQESLLENPRMRDFITKVTVPVFLKPFVSVAYGLSGAIRRDYYIEAGVQAVLLRREQHSLSMAALSTYRNPDKTTPAKQEGVGHSQVSLAYSYGGVRLAGNYIFAGRDEVLAVNDVTQYSTSVGYTASF
jgi:hypothetical protein